MNDFASYVLWAIAVLVVLYFGMRVFGIARGAYKLSHATPRHLPPARHVLWRDPGAIERFDLASGPGGPQSIPTAPFRFIEEHANGTQPCVSVRDANGRRWRAKWGAEVRSETFAVRLAWACGYFSEITHFVPAGRIDGAGPLTRAAACVDDSGTFTDARFELDDPDVQKFFDEHSWSSTENPFVGTPELAGLKVLLMLISNWDAKDQRDAARGSNTAIYVAPGPHGEREAQYLVVDWGGSMGRWGQTIVTRGRWDPEGFAAQTPQFVSGLTNGVVHFGYTGQRTGDVRSDIRVEEVAWLGRMLMRISDAQLRAALRASGATEGETASLTASLRARIDQLLDVAGLRPAVRPTQIQTRARA